MADKEDQSTKTPNIFKKLASSIQSSLDVLYSKTYFTSPNNKNDLTVTKDNINKAIDNIISTNINANGKPNISSFFTRLDAIQKDGKTVNKISELFNDRGVMDGLISGYSQNKVLKEMDDEIDTVLKYCPQLLEALEIRKDNVLSADHFSKDYINISDEMNASGDTKFQKRCKDIKDKYDLLNQMDEWYDKAAKYGEVFIYVVPYKQALSKLLKLKDGVLNTPYTGSLVPANETGKVKKRYKRNTNTQTDIIQEGTISVKTTELKESAPSKFEGAVNVKVEFNMTGMLYTEVESLQKFHKLAPVCESKSLNNQFNEIITEASKSSQKFDKINDFTIDEKKHNKKNSTAEPVDIKKKREVEKGIVDINPNLDYSSFEDQISSDGLITDADLQKHSEKENENDENKIKSIGCVVKELDRYNIIPLYIHNMCLGYYYIEFKENLDYAITSRLTDPTISLKSSTKLYNDTEKAKQDEFLKFISAKLSAEIDAKFINANQDITKEIYYILKHNDTYNSATPEGMRVTFLPAEDVEHIYFKMNEKTHRGISDLAAAMFPAKLYAGLYITNVIAIMTRGQDRRVFKVRQSIDSNIAANLLNVIEQIKKFNFNVRQIENINQVLNIIGRFNDFVIPIGPNGEQPVDFDIMPGQQIEVQTEFMQKLVEMAVNATDVPLELISARQSIDYAAQLTMTNSKFLRKIYTRQGKFQINCSRIFTKIYNSEYLECSNIKIQLPPPIFLNITNTDQLANNIMNLSQTIADIVCPDGDPDPDAALVKTTVLAKIKREKLGSFIDFNKIDAIYEQSKQEVAKRKEEFATGEE